MDDDDTHGRVRPFADETYMHLLRRARIARGLTQTALAKKLKLVPSTVSQWESGSSLPSPRLVPRLSRILGVDAMELTRLISPDRPPPASAAAVVAMA